MHYTLSTKLCLPPRCTRAMHFHNNVLHQTCFIKRACWLCSARGVDPVVRVFVFRMQWHMDFIPRPSVLHSRRNLKATAPMKNQMSTVRSVNTVRSMAATDTVCPAGQYRPSTPPDIADCTDIPTDVYGRGRTFDSTTDFVRRIQYDRDRKRHPWGPWGSNQHTLQYT